VLGCLRVFSIDGGYMFEVFKKKKIREIFSPVIGKSIILENVPDKTFSSKMMGDGIAFNFTEMDVWNS